MRWADAMRIVDDAIAADKSGERPTMFQAFWARAGKGDYEFTDLDSYHDYRRKLLFSELPSPYLKFLRAQRDTDDVFLKRTMLMSLIYTPEGKDDERA